MGRVALEKGLIGIVKSSLTGSIIGNLLLGLGVSMLAGGFRVKTQKFEQPASHRSTEHAGARHVRPHRSQRSTASRRRARTILPGVSRTRLRSSCSWCTSASLVFTLITHKPVVGKAAVTAEKKEAGEPTTEDDKPQVHWSRGKAILVLGAGLGCARVHERDPHRRS